MAPESGFSVTTSDGFTVRSDPRGGLNYFLYGERWPAEGEPFEPVTLIEALAKELERLSGGVAQADQEDVKLIYVKRWRTIVKLPAKYADEIVEALRFGGATQAAVNPAAWSEVGLVILLAEKFPQTFTTYGDGKTPNALVANVARYLSSLSSTDGAAPAPASLAWQVEKERLMQWIVSLLNRVAKLEIALLAAPPSVATIPLTTETMSTLAQPGQRAAEAEPSNVAGSHPAVSRKVFGPCAGSNPAGARSVVNGIVAPSVALEADTREKVAEAIYDQMPYDLTGYKPPWIPRGNSRKQDEARWYADAAIAALTRPQPGGER